MDFDFDLFKQVMLYAGIFGAFCLIFTLITGPSSTPPSSDAPVNNVQNLGPVEQDNTDANWSYQNCDAARAAGAAPVNAGEAGYGRHLDRDRDGVGCE